MVTTTSTSCSNGNSSGILSQSSSVSVSSMSSSTAGPGGVMPVVMDSSTSNVGSSGGPTRTTNRVSDNRRSNKPIMEKRRRARINNCLNELKTLILDAMKKDPARHSKLEKADILEMTVKHLQNLQRQQTAMSSVTDPAVVNKFRAGFTECATEVGRFPGLEPVVKRKLLQHLANCLSQANNKPQEVPQVQVHILPNNPHRSPEQQVPQSGIILSNGQGAGVQLLPTRLPSGEIALVLPASAQHHSPMPSPVPLLVPILPERSASTASTGSSSGYSPSQSPEPMDTTMYCQAQQKPLSLVVRKLDENVENPEERPWRPW